MTKTAEHLRDALDDLEHAVEGVAMPARSLRQRGEELREDILQARAGKNIQAAEYDALIARLSGIVQDILKG